MACPHHRAARNGRARRRVLAATGLSIVLGLSAACGSRSGSDANPALDPANELPFGNLDVPVAAAQVNAQILVGGWAMDDRGVREVRVYVDGRFANATPLNFDRPDVSKMFPPVYVRGGNLHGWGVNVGFAAPGPHTVLAQAVDSDGATKDIGTVSVTSREQ